ncbi:hypothetical protein E4U17_001701 [Claviceps sp. LM77 group G4]|nr:hypothetical protein E4U17_001701 [Claviceps sp. LM77 group G4]KAG6044028.1 hypothetical protein E4U33_001630 [Claviceps sp. LM78 group G4]KAG6069546.1 hypothetical protein E4U16_007612 [Claviceps sp. LM84 group G4]
MAYARAQSADDIFSAEFWGLVAEYPAVVEAVSESRTVKPGQKTLLELDAYRYGDALGAFRVEDHPEMTLAQVQDLVEWKLRHGTFRPALMTLVKSNDARAAQATISSAIKAYRANMPSSLELHQDDHANASQMALDILTKLRGIGPATASLLLSVHDPLRVIFFSDEAYWWLCCGGRKDVVIRYSVKEYRLLCEKAAALARRLGGETQMVDVEKAAYVAMRAIGDHRTEKIKKTKTKTKTKTKGEMADKAVEECTTDAKTGHAEKPPKTEALPDEGKDSAKRKAAQEKQVDEATELRRSKRRKQPAKR